jgi:isopentenyl-diphosphate Delta-isomerase
MTGVPEQPDELVVLCDPDGSAAGTAPKATVHHRRTPLHLAFSCYLFDQAGRVLLTRRARDKKTFGGVLTNSCCGHPAPGEELATAVRRRLSHELGVTARDVRLVLPAFRYRAAAVDGTVENELCPVFLATTVTAEFEVNPAEVDAAWWTPWPELLRSAAAGEPLSPWAADQLVQLAVLGPDPLNWPVGDAALLPAAARSPRPPPAGRASAAGRGGQV